MADLTAIVTAFRPGLGTTTGEDEYDVQLTDHAHVNGSGASDPAVYARTVSVPMGDDPSDAIRHLAASVAELIDMAAHEATAAEPVVPLGAFDLG